MLTCKETMVVVETCFWSLGGTRSRIFLLILHSNFQRGREQHLVDVRTQLYSSRVLGKRQASSTRILYVH